MVPRGPVSSRNTNDADGLQMCCSRLVHPIQSCPCDWGASKRQTGLHLIEQVHIIPSTPRLSTSQMSQLPGQHIPLGNSSLMLVIPEGYSQVKNHVLSFKFTETGAQDVNAVPYFIQIAPRQYYTLPPEYGRDESNATAHSEILVIPSTAPQSLPLEPAHSADLAIHAVDASGGVDSPSPSETRFRCGHCPKTFGRQQELTRHLEQVDKPRQICPFKPCTYNWIRPDKIKAHIINVHGSECCSKVLEEIRKLRGKKVIDFLDAYDFEMYDKSQPWQPLLEPSGIEPWVFYLRCVFSSLRTSQ